MPDPENEGEYITETAVETLNSMVPLWRKNKSEITAEDYNEFYKMKFIGLSGSALRYSLQIRGHGNL